MTLKNAKPDARPVFRLFAGILAIPMILVGIMNLFPGMFGLKDDSNFGLVFIFLFGGFTFLGLAITGSVNKVGKQRARLHLAAMKYTQGEIELDEYGEQTREILGG